MGLSLAVHGVGIAHIGVEKGAENGFRERWPSPRRPQQPLFGGGEGVLSSAALVVQVAAVPLQPRGGLVEALQGLLGNGHDLGGGEAERGTDGGEHAHELANHGLIGGVAGVLVRLAHGVVGQQLALAVHVLYQVQECAEGLAAFAQLSGKGGGFSLSGRQGGQGLLPALIRGYRSSSAQVSSWGIWSRARMVSEFDIVKPPFIFMEPLYHTMHKFPMAWEIILCIVFLFILWYIVPG